MLSLLRGMTLSLKYTYCHQKFKKFMRIHIDAVVLIGSIGAPGRIRTCGTRIRNPMLYPLSYGGLVVYSMKSFWPG